MIALLLHWKALHDAKRRVREARVAMLEARVRREAALAKMIDAQRRNDARDLGRARMERQAATTDCVRAEVAIMRARA